MRRYIESSTSYIVIWEILEPSDDSFVDLSGENCGNLAEVNEVLVVSLEFIRKSVIAFFIMFLSALLLVEGYH